MRHLGLLWSVCICSFAGSHARLQRISNLKPQLSKDGSIVNAHGGNIVYWNKTYFLYGENYGEGHFVVTGNTAFPKLAVYTSTDMVQWEWQGYLHNNSAGVAGAPSTWADSGKWPKHPKGAWYSPEAVWDERSKKIVLWWTASKAECCDAYWGVAQSSDGIHFELITLEEKPSQGSSVDGSSLLLDEDGQNYVAYTAMHVPGRDAHVVTIERLRSDMLGSTGQQIGGFFPDDFVEGIMLFKRHGLYYMLYGSCCCACREGSGVVVHTASDIAGPWTRQGTDVNCAANVSVCAGMDPGALPRPTGKLIINAQGLGLSVLPSANPKQSIYLWSGARWLSGPNNPPKCTSLCRPGTGDCAQPANYIKGNDFDYWIPLEFDDKGRIQRFKPFVDDFNLDLIDWTAASKDTSSTQYSV